MATTIRAKAPFTGQFFSRLEMRCRCWRPSCDAPAMNAGFMERLNALRHDWGRPLIVNSAARCAEHNAKVGGSPTSKHLLGIAVDLRANTPNDAQALAALAEKHGFRGIGIAKTFVHLDMREGPTARWDYP